MTLHIPTWLLVVGLILLAFFLGTQYSRRGHRFRVKLPKILVGILASAFTLLALFGGLFYVSPTLFSKVVALIPNEVGNVIGQDWMARYLLYGDMTGFFVFAIGAALLWWWFSRIE